MLKSILFRQTLKATLNNNQHITSNLICCSLYCPCSVATLPSVVSACHAHTLAVIVMVTKPQISLNSHVPDVEGTERL